MANHNYLQRSKPSASNSEISVQLNMRNSVRREEQIVNIKDNKEYIL